MKKNIADDAATTVSLCVCFFKCFQWLFCFFFPMLCQSFNQQMNQSTFICKALNHKPRRFFTVKKPFEPSTAARKNSPRPKPRADTGSRGRSFALTGPSGKHRPKIKTKGQIHRVSTWLLHQEICVNSIKNSPFYPQSERKREKRSSINFGFRVRHSIELSLLC